MPTIHTIPCTVAMVAASAFIVNHTQQGLSSQSFIGKWVSFSLQGKDIGNEIIRIEFTFNKDQTFSAIAFFRNGEHDQRKGGYSFVAGFLHLKVNNEVDVCKVDFIQGDLVIHDPSLESEIRLRRSSQ